MENTKDFESLQEKNILLRNQRLFYYNLLSVANDEILVLKNFSQKPKKRAANEETFEYFEILKESHEEFIAYCCECLHKETGLIENGGGDDIRLYILELEQILKQKMKSCEFLLNIARGLKLSYN